MRRQEQMNLVQHPERKCDLLSDSRRVGRVDPLQEIAARSLWRHPGVSRLELLEIDVDDLIRRVRLEVTEQEQPGMFQQPYPEPARRIERAPRPELGAVVENVDRPAVDVDTQERDRTDRLRIAVGIP